MIQWLIVRMIVRQAIGKFVRNLMAHVKAGGWNRTLPKATPKRNFRGRFETPATEQPQPPAMPRDNLGERTMTGEQIAGFVRHILTFAGGWAVAQGYVDESMAMEAVGAVSTLVGLAWSYFHKMQMVRE